MGRLLGPEALVGGTSASVLILSWYLWPEDFAQPKTGTEIERPFRTQGEQDLLFPSTLRIKQTGYYLPVGLSCLTLKQNTFPGPALDFGVLFPHLISFPGWQWPGGGGPTWGQVGGIPHGTSQVKFPNNQKRRQPAVECSQTSIVQGIQALRPQSCWSHSIGKNAKTETGLRNIQSQTKAF